MSNLLSFRFVIFLKLYTIIIIYSKLYMPNNLDIRRNILIIKNSGLFDADHYNSQFDALINNPIEHYVIRGWRENKNPCKLFNTKYYLDNNPDVKNTVGKMNPFAHWIKFGKNEGRDPNDNNTLSKDDINTIGKIHNTPANLSNIINDDSNLVFIIIRHVNSESSNLYWKHSYSSIRQFYPTTSIIIIDDNSPFKKFGSINLSNCEIINSEYPQRGELLPYYYFHKLKK